MEIDLNLNINDLHYYLYTESLYAMIDDEILWIGIRTGKYGKASARVGSGGGKINTQFIKVVRDVKNGLSTGPG